MKRIIIFLVCFNIAISSLQAAKNIYCPNLSQDLYPGQTDLNTKGQISELQKFLTDYFDIKNQELTGGTYGNKTKNYVLKFKKDKSLDLVDKIGKGTRDEIKKACNSASSPNSTDTTLNPKVETKQVDIGKVSLKIPTNFFLVCNEPKNSFDYKEKKCDLTSGDKKIKVQVTINDLLRSLYVVEDDITDEDYVFEPYSKIWWLNFKKTKYPETNLKSEVGFPIYTKTTEKSGNKKQVYFSFLENKDSQNKVFQAITFSYITYDGYKYNQDWTLESKILDILKTGELVEN